MFRTTRRPRYADVVATLALVLALGGTTAYAVQSLPKHSVGKAQLQKDAVTSSKIKNGKVKTKDIADGGIISQDLAEGAVTNAKIANLTIISSDLAAGSVNGSKVIDKTLTLDDLAGGTGTSTVSYTDLAAGACQAIVVPVAGATSGQFAVIGLTNAGNADGVSFAPARATAGTVSSRLCNVSGGAVTGSLVIRAITFG